jgi:hypothetical protein
MSRYILSVPPVFYQTNLYCWAAGGASWLRATHLGNATPEQLIERFGGYMNKDGSLPEGSEPDDDDALKGGMQEVFRQLNAYIEKVDDFTYAYALDKLKRKGHLLLLEGVGGDMGHTYVVYGVGVPSDDYFSVFDSLRGSGCYRNRKFSSVSGHGAYVGWAAWAGKS